MDFFFLKEQTNDTYFLKIIKIYSILKKNLQILSQIKPIFSELKIKLKDDPSQNVPSELDLNDRPLLRTVI